MSQNMKHEIDKKKMNWTVYEQLYVKLTGAAREKN